MRAKTTLPKLKPHIVRKSAPQIGEYIAQCDIVDDKGKRYGTVNCGRAHTIDREEDIAWLWAAAPEMYEALSEHLCGSCGVKIGHEPYIDIGPCRNCADARKVIAKARGEAP